MHFLGIGRALGPLRIRAARPSRAHDLARRWPRRWRPPPPMHLFRTTVAEARMLHILSGLALDMHRGRPPRLRLACFLAASPWAAPLLVQHPASSAARPSHRARRRRSSSPGFCPAFQTQWPPCAGRHGARPARFHQRRRRRQSQGRVTGEHGMAQPCLPQHKYSALALGHPNIVDRPRPVAGLRPMARKASGLRASSPDRRSRMVCTRWRVGSAEAQREVRPSDRSVSLHSVWGRDWGPHAPDRMRASAAWRQWQ
mmetsp:Transcript_4024/g.12895  ORF Transcript_4024/g.12895 Transcript_4024/m.12895 type:complete len:256 (+) Transcript_4024:650-1417(+)